MINQRGAEGAFEHFSQSPFLPPAFLQLSLTSNPPSTQFLSFLPYSPLLLTLVFLASSLVRRLSPRSSPTSFFAPFISPADILATPGFQPLPTSASAEVPRGRGADQWLALVGIPAFEGLVWAATAAVRLMRVLRGSEGGWGAVRRDEGVRHAVAFAFVWVVVLVTQARALARTPPLRVLALVALLLATAVVDVVVQVHDTGGRWNWESRGRILDLAGCFAVSTVIVRMPLEAEVGALETEGKEGDERSPRRPRSPEDTNTLLGSLTYAWMGPIMVLAKKRPLRSNDVWALSLNNRAEVLARKFRRLKEKTLLGRILHASARDVALDFSLKLVAVTLGYLRPYFIQRILECLTPSSTSSLPNSSPSWSPHSLAYIYAVLAFLSMSGQSLAQLQHFHLARRTGMRLRSELTVTIFEKVLVRRDTGGRVGGGEGGEEASAGKVVTLVSEDTDRVLRMGCDSHLIYGAPLEITLALLFLYNLMGWSAFVGFAILAFMVPINYELGKRSIAITRGRSAARDDRQASLEEMIAAVKTIKFFGWTEAWVAKTEEKRAVELHWMIKEWTNSILMTLLWSFISVVVPLSAFWFFVKVQEKELTVAIAFTALSLFTMVRGPLNQIPDFGIRILQTQVSIKRMESFLAEEDVASHASIAGRASAGDCLAFHHATLEWHASIPEQKPFRLHDVDIVFPPGGLTIICGPTGSGKTSLLLALLGELDVVSGSVELPKVISYAAQHPWLESCSIRDNILFGMGYSRDRYFAVLDACALAPDLVSLPAGDATHVGERGVSLSGGQKARIALARALYAPTKHVLLDDVFSAVDSHTARRLFATLTGPLLRGRTCVLVTHHVDLVLPGAAYRIELDAGRVVSHGPVNQAGAKALLPDEDEEEEGPAETNDAAKAVDEEEDEVEGEGIPEEGWMTGEVAHSIYTTYLKASGYSIWAVLLLLMLGRPALAFLEQYWLRLWGEASSRHEKVDSTFFLAGYAAIGFSSTALLVGSTIVLYLASYRASRSIFSELVLRVVRAPARWFDVTPIGRITARFTRDISTVDGAIATNFSNFANHLLSMTAALLITVVILPATFVPTAVFATFYANMFFRYLNVNRDINRIGATTASPLFSTFHQVLVGISTVRAFAKERDYRAQLCIIVDETLALWYCTCTLDVWLSIRTQLLSSCCLVATATFAIYSGVSPGLAGIAITSSQSIIQSLDWLCGAYGRLVMGLNSLERITEYLELPQERSDGVFPPANWPSSAASALIVVDNLTVAYSPELPPVLNGLSFSIKPGERIAVAGRTGSGKSTLAMSLLRFVDPSHGSIAIDGLDITRVALEDLRRRITFLPQDAVLFSGTIRENLDPLSVHSDGECLDALRRVHLLSEDTAVYSGASIPAAFVDGGLEPVPNGVRRVRLETAVSSGGHNFSSGQRQLIALARALLRDSRIIIFDESTAAIDFELDCKIQETIRTEFSGACLITIAHRLRTIIDYERVLVLDGGRLVEFDSPAALLASDSAFHAMCKESGDYEDLVDRTRTQ